MSAALHLIIGPVGAGKSTFAAALAAERGALRLTLDDWMARLYGADARPQSGVVDWYLERRDRCLDQIWEVAADALALGVEVVLEVGLIRRDERLAFYERVDRTGAALTIYVLDAPRELRRERVERRNREQGATFAVVVPPQIFEMASDMWQAPDADECRARDVRILPMPGEL